MSLCGGCLASDRTLKPVTTSLLRLLHFLDITPNRGRPKKNTNLILFCWECSSFLNRIREFHCKVKIAQEHLTRQRNKTELKPLSNLHITTINKDYDLIITEEEKLSIEFEIKEEFDHSDNVDEDKFETFENLYKSDHSDFENTEDDIKDFTDDIDNQNIFGSDENIPGSSENIPDSSENIPGSIENIPGSSENISCNSENNPGSSRNNCVNSRNYNTRSRTLKDVTKINDTAILDPVVTLPQLIGIKVKDEIKLESQDTLDVSDIKNVSKRKSRKGQLQKKKFKVLHCAELQSEELTKYIKEPETDMEKIRQWFHHIWQTAEFTSNKYKCLCCLKTFLSDKGYLSHMKIHHLNGKDEFVCDICDRRFETKTSLTLHLYTHKYRYTCELCKEDFYMKNRILKHLQRHRTRIQCLECGVVFEWLREFYAHYRSLHAAYTCDYCGKIARIKSSLEKHMRRHTLQYCKICNKRFKYLKTYRAHYRMRHLISESESTYCVECNIIFPTLESYKCHLRSTRIHNDKLKKKYPCQICKKEYASKYSMNYHYQYYHLKKTEYYCGKCNKYMLSPARLREHNMRVHDKIPLPKNKFCDICGRGFSEKKILINHRRTHTGERPYQCEYCSAAFAQKSAMNTHIKTQHKVFVIKH